MKPSENQNFKIDVYDLNGKFLFGGGSPTYLDYPHYIQSKGKEYADKRRRLYRIRHYKEIQNVRCIYMVLIRLLQSYFKILIEKLIRKMRIETVSLTIKN